MELQWSRFACRALMAEVIGQYKVVSAHAVIEIIPWCAEWSTFRTYYWSKDDITMQSL